MFFLPQNKLFFFFNKPVPRKALEQIFAFNTTFPQTTFQMSTFLSEMPGMSFANMIGRIFKEQCETNTCVQTHSSHSYNLLLYQKMCLTKTFIFLHRAVMHENFFLTKHFVFTSYDSTRTVLNSIRMDNSVPMSVLQLHQIT